MSKASDVYLVTGACGFLGQRICQLLLEEEQGIAEIRLFDKNSRPELIQSLQASASRTKVSMLEGDIRDAELLRRACQGVSVVIHTASLIDIVGAVDYSELHGVNVKGTQLLLEACIQESVPSFVYTSSIEVAGPNPRGDPVVDGDEDTPYTPCLKFPYSRTKQEGEQLSLQAHGESLRNGGRLATCALRPMYIYGEGCRFLLFHMGNGIRNGDVLLRTSHPDARVNPVYVGNVAFAHVRAARALKDAERRAVVGGNFYFVSDDTPPASYSDFNHAVMSPLCFGIQEKFMMPYPLLVFLAFVMEMLQWLLRPFMRYSPPLNRQLLVMVNTAFTFSYRKAQRDIGYTPRYSWEEARKRTSDWLASVLPRERDRLKTH
ncbi:hydroxy-delta-5-steroid dehydrogenase, 3 beta- and steroid delta-isomerase 1 [Conger conger]|uniref:hydroxy-delta-5-steroid dehydrogenase, 3 beta- and steroid delta-isomerase 1 n=1 Tax=Conger conger TaxID=82655 RepID=UPI002A5AD2E1|nr:hydroxy-delta-5-steroid dehydrogenase, 3 beta- and steroid delta-isomerase 1 [Conger conger]XP_061081686.1 hydroxy-delta-5-steroid dehydrogenase, 3 beta- and steroid delta-isomerase 1 [Conger conger]XP_061081687.1 hydroxy-delta-5-steroid dehydrogenase, 3 beta- and steroid delta-isomerase 1 [Conger conger]XP_061081688.1 hydroxy-delta-5-steroid dehydrogenase, 3 beta- and steroid delta-isomerase 1 [Conger conger]XP_061081690.1 hydroxy-delta-5-steroid dehydrogenase, 3 beta- and steroid delta-iso